MNHAFLLATLTFATSLAAQSSGFVIPAAQAGSLGNTSSMFPFSYTNYVRFQQAIGTPHFAGPTTLNAMALRSRTVTLNVPEVQNQGMQVTLADCLKPVGALDPTYANNIGPNAKVVFNGTFNIQKPNSFDALEFNTLIPFDFPYLHLNLSPLLVELIPTSFMGQACNGGGNGTTFDYVSTDPNMSTILGKGACAAPPTANASASPGGYVIKFWSRNELYPFGKACGATGVASISSSGGLPTPGNAGFTLNLGSVPAGTPPLAAMILGVSDQMWGSNTLPYSLTSINMTNCFLNVSLDFSVTIGVAAGSASMPLPVPNAAYLIGQVVLAQGVAVANGANPLNVITTQGGRVTIR